MQQAAQIETSGLAASAPLAVGVCVSPPTGEVRCTRPANHMRRQLQDTGKAAEAEAAEEAAAA